MMAMARSPISDRLRSAGGFHGGEAMAAMFLSDFAETGSWFRLFQKLAFLREQSRGLGTHRSEWTRLGATVLDSALQCSALRPNLEAKTKTARMSPRGLPLMWDLAAGE
jgi:hypothetical protein